MFCVCISCNHAHIADKGIVKQVEEYSKGHYKINVSFNQQISFDVYHVKDICIFTTKLYNVGDTVVLTKK